MKSYGKIVDLEQFQKFIQDNLQLVCKSTYIYLLALAIDFQMNEVKRHLFYLKMIEKNNKFRIVLLWNT
jgi:hypothetical protein